MKIQLTFSFLALGLTLSACAETGTASSGASIIAFPEGAEVRRIEALPPLDDGAQRRVGVFTKPGHIKYFGAMAISDKGSFGVTGGFHTLETAKASALARCRDRAKRTDRAPKSCRVRIIVVPKGYAGQTGLTLSEYAGKAWRRYLSKPGPKAFAYGQPRSYASNFAGVSIPFARNRVLSSCNEASRQSGDGKPCRVIDVSP